MKLLKSIIVEGYENCGKSTLVEELSNLLQAPVYLSKGAPKSDKQFFQCLSEQFIAAENLNIFDRVTCISHPIYNGALKQSHRNACTAYADYMILNHVIIYCRPPIEVMTNFSTHVHKDYNSPEHEQFVENNASDLISAYDNFMCEAADMNFNVLRYDYSHPTTSVSGLLAKLKEIGAID